MKKIVIMTLVFMILLGVSAQPKAISNLQNGTAAKEPEKYPVTLSAKQQDLIVGDKWEFTIQAAKKSDLEGKSLYIDLPDQFKLDIDKTVKANKWDDAVKRGYSAKENKLILNEQMQAKLADAIVVYGEITKLGNFDLQIKNDNQKQVSDSLEVTVHSELSVEPKAPQLDKKTAPPLSTAAADPDTYPGGVSAERVKVGDLDFSALDSDANEKDGYTRMTKNDPIFFETKEKNREYYNVFGTADNERTVSSFRNKTVSERDSLFRPLPTDTTMIAPISALKDPAINNHVMASLMPSVKSGAALVSYTFEKGRAVYGGWEVVFGKTVSEPPGRYGGSGKGTLDMPLLKLYKNENGDILAYGVALKNVGTISNRRIVGLVKLKVSRIGSKDKQAVSLKFQRINGGMNEEAEWKYTNIFYGVHMDIAGRHTASKMYSLGNNKGLYFKESKLRDGFDYYLSFSTKGFANAPSALVASDSPSSSALNNGLFKTLDAPGTPDPGKDKLFPFTKHPAWAIRWEPKIQSANEVREATIQLDVKSSPPTAPNLEIEENGYEEDQYIIKGSWEDEDSDDVTLYYQLNDEAPQKVGDYENPDKGKQQPFTIKLPAEKVKKGLDHDIQVYVVDDDELTSKIETIQLRPTMRIQESIMDNKGKEITQATPGETIFYRIGVFPGYIEQDKGTFTAGTIIQAYSPFLEAPEDMKVVDQEGNEVGKAVYDVNLKQIKVVLHEGISRNKPISVIYQAKVKNNTPRGSIVKTSSKVNAAYSTDQKVEALSEDTELLVAGELKFESVPENFSFGTQLINTKTELFPLQEYEPALTIKDTRGDSNRWKLNVSISQTITGQKTGQELHGLLYLKGKHKQEISAVPQTIETGEEGLAKISQEWNEKDNGFFLEVPPGVAKSDRYQGEIQWELQDAP